MNATDYLDKLGKEAKQKGFDKPPKQNGSAVNATSATNAKCNSLESQLDVAKAPPIPGVVYDNIPQRLKNLCSLVDTDYRRDVFLVSSLPVLSSQMPNVLAAHRDCYYSPDIFVQVVAGPGTGKGEASKALPLGLETDRHIREESKLEIQHFEETPDEEKTNLDTPKQQSLLIPVNASSRKMLDRIDANNGNGLLFETEIDTLIDATKQDWGNYTGTIRKSFHHEPLSIIRTDGEYYINNPRLSVLLTGTFDQFKAMFESAENGHFSRYALYTFDAPRKWQSHRPTRNSQSLQESVAESGKEMYEMYRRLSNRNTPLYIDLTDEQWEHIDKTFSEKMQIIENLGLSKHLHASNNRAAIIALRLSMIFTILRVNDEDPYKLTDAEQLIPTMQDFTAALELADTFIKHAFRLYYILPNADNDSKGERYKNFVSSLPNEFETSDALLVGEEHNIPERTVKHWLSNMDEFKRIRRGHYEKHNKKSSINWGY